MTCSSVTFHPCYELTLTLCFSCLRLILFVANKFLLLLLLHQLTKYDDNTPIHGVEIAPWWNSKWRPPPSWLLVRWQFWSYDPIYGAILYLHQTFELNRSLNPGRSYGYFFPNARWRLPSSRICKNDDFRHAFYYRVSFCTILPKLMKIRLSME